MNQFLLILAALFSVINPIGTIPIFVGLTKGKERKEVSRIAFWTAINTCIILFISFFSGEYVLLFFGISLPALKIAGGMIIASSGFALLTGSFSKHKGMKRGVKEDALTRSDVALTPLAMPMLAGPGTISLLIGYNQEYYSYSSELIIVLDIISISLVIFFILQSSNLIVRLMGASGINALSRIIGFIVIAIGVEYILSTLIFLIKNTI